MRGYFSWKQYLLIGSFIYLNPEGEEVVVTSVGENPPNFDDVKCQGEVSTFVRKVSGGNAHKKNFCYFHKEERNEQSQFPPNIWILKK